MQPKEFVTAWGLTHHSQLAPFIPCTNEQARRLLLPDEHPDHRPATTAVQVTLDREHRAMLLYREVQGILAAEPYRILAIENSLGKVD